MDLDALKKQFRHKRKAEIADIEIALQAVPFLVREVERLEKELKDHKDRIVQLTTMMNKRPSLERKGKKGKGEWIVKVDDEKNRLYLKLTGYFDYHSAKVASNNITSVITNLREDADVINDMRGLMGFDKRAVFHIRKLIYTLDYVGVSRVVRVTNPESNISNLLDKIYSGETDYTMSLVHSIKEAEKILESSRQFLKA